MPLLYDGSADRVRSVTAALLQGSRAPFTYLAWMNHNDTFSADSECLSSADLDTDVDYMVFGIQDSSGKAFVKTRNGGGDSEEVVLSTTSTIDNNWVLVTLVCVDDSTRRILLNGGGAGEGTGEKDGAAFSTTSVAGFVKDTSTFAPLMVEDICGFNFAMTDAEVLAYYNAKIRGMDSMHLQNIIFNMPHVGFGSRKHELYAGLAWVSDGTVTDVIRPDGPGLNQRKRNFASYSSAHTPRVGNGIIGQGVGLFPQDP